MKFQTILIALLSASSLVACTPNLSSDQIDASNANQINQTVPGKIIEKKVIVVSANENNKTGTIAGGLAGGIAGSAIGGGNRVPLLGAIGGALIGGMVGNAIQEKVSTQQAYQYVIKLNSGSYLTVVQGLTPAYEQGQCVFVISSGHARITQVVNDASICH